MKKLTDEERKKIHKFLFGQVQKWIKDLSCNEYQEMRDRAYQNWHRAGCGFGSMQQGGTGQMMAIIFYQNKIKPGSKEWRPKIIIEGILNHLEKEAAAGG